MTIFDSQLFVTKVNSAFVECLCGRGLECKEEIDEDQLQYIIGMCVENAESLVELAVRQSGCPISFDPNPPELSQLVDESQQIVAEVQAAIDHNDPEAELVALRDLFRIALEMGKAK
jgi:hypothetical protein